MRVLAAALLFLAACSDAETPVFADAAAVGPDASVAQADAEPVEADAGVVSADAAEDQPDASEAEPDATVHPDAAVVPTGPYEGSLVRLTDFSAFELDEVAVENGHLVLGTGHSGNDPFGAGGYHGGNYYNGGSYRYGVAVSPVLELTTPFDELVPSFEADTPDGAWVTIKVRARIDGRWTKDYVLGVWAYDSATVQRHSVDNQGDADGQVYTDTLALSEKADALQLIAVLLSEGSGVAPTIRALAASAIDSTRAPRPDPGDPNAYGISLTVPGRSQMIYPEGGEVWCSPTSTSMILAYYASTLQEPALSETVPLAAAYTFDWIYDGMGNWPFNTAHASAIAGGRLSGFVTRLDSFAQLERLIVAGIPAAISISYENGELSGSPIRSTAGHLIVVTGFAANGDVVVNDPAFESNDTVDTVYDRAELDGAWSNSNRTAYIIYPRDRSLPVDPLGAY